MGVALKKEKAEKHITPKLIATAAKAGIVLKLIDPDQSLESQEPFSVLLHKIRDVGKVTCTHLRPAALKIRMNSCRRCLC